MMKSKQSFTAISGPVSPHFLALVQQAEFLFSAGQIRQALQLAKHCLSLDSQNAHLLSFAGICAVTLGDKGDAERHWRRSIAIDPAIPEVHFNLGLLLAKNHQAVEAEQCYRRAISLAPRNAEAYCNLGNLLNDGEREEEAEACYRSAIALNPRFEAAYYNLGNARLKRGDWEEAEMCYRQANTLNPADAQTLAKLGFVLAKRKCMPEAEQCYRQAIAIDSGCAEAHANLGLLLTDSQRLDEAERCFRQAMALSPDSPEIFSNLGNLLAQCGREDEAEQYYRQALSLNPASAPAYCNLGVLLATRKRDAEAEACFRQALACNPEHALAQLNLAYLLLHDGRWEEGWAYHESRYAGEIPEPIAAMAAICPTPWLGEPLAGKSLLVLSEQGFGDAIQFCRYLAALKDQGAAHITLICRSELKALFTTLAGVDTLMDSEDTKQGIPPHDYWTLMLSLPFQYKATLQAIPTRIPYLHALPERLARWSPRLPSDGFRVGLVWKGNRLHSNDVKRSLAGLSVLNPLWLVPGIHFVSLQKGRDEEEALRPAADQPLLDLGFEIADFADTAAIVECLDLIICVDTSIAHLAGALGKPCWVMLPDYKTDWRWLRDRDDSPWYPQTMRLFRQQARDDWEPVVADIKQALGDLVASAYFPNRHS